MENNKFKGMNYISYGIDLIAIGNTITSKFNYMDKEHNLLLGENKRSDLVFRTSLENRFVDSLGFVRLKFSDGFNYINVNTKEYLFKKNRNYTWVEPFFNNCNLAIVTSFDVNYGDYVNNFIDSKGHQILNHWFSAMHVKDENTMVFLLKYGNYRICKFENNKWSMKIDELNEITEEDKVILEDNRIFDKTFYDKMFWNIKNNSWYDISSDV